MRKPNVLIIHTDQQRWDALGANGNDIIQTPNLDRLAREGVNYDCCISQNPVCMPSRISLLSGQYCSTLGLQHMAVPVPENTVCLQHLLARQGYHTGLIGKLHFLPHSNRDHRDPHPAYGFDHMELSDEPGCYEDDYRAWVRRKAPEELDNISVGLPPVTEYWQMLLQFQDGIVHPKERNPNCGAAYRCHDDVTHSAFVAEQALGYLDQHQSEPFFLFAGFYSPHSPWLAPQWCLDLYDEADMPVPEFPPELEAQRREGHFDDTEIRSVTRGYYAMVSEVDYHVGRILDKLDELDLAHDTIVVFTSDHGEWLGEHLLYGKGRWAQDCISRVPLIIRDPASVAEPGTTVSNIVECVDVVPTVLSCAGLPVPRTLQGNCILPGLVNDCIDDDGLGLTEHTGWKSLRMDGFRYVSEADGNEMLFDLEQDPMEYHNVAADAAYADQLAESRRRMLQRLIAMERPKPKTWPY